MKNILCFVVIVLVVDLLQALSLPSGNWGSIDTNDARVMEVAEFVAKELGQELISVRSAESQVVAGYNYRLELSLGSGCLLNECVVLVWWKPDGTKELTSKECTF